QGLSIVEMIYDTNNKPVDFRYLETNSVFNKESGLNNVIGKTIKELVPKIDNFWIEIYEKVLLTGEPVKFTQKADSMKSWFDVNAFRLGETGSKKLAILFTNVTEQKKSEESIAKIASHFKLATDSANVGIWSLNVQSQELEWSDIHKTMWGYDLNRIDLTFYDWHAIILEKDKELAFQRVEDARINHTEYEVEYRIKRANDNEIRWMKSFGKYYYDELGEAVTLTGISLDVTEQKSFTKELEKKVTERTKDLAIKTKQLEQINKKLDKNIIELENANVELKSFSYIASHDLQEPLRIIRMFIQRIAQMERFSDKTVTYFNYITDATERMRNLIISLIDFSRLDKTDLKLVSCDLNTIVEDSKRDLQISIAEKQAVIEYENLPLIFGHQIQLSQLFTNIISNALKYSKETVQPKIEIKSKRIKGNKIINSELLEDLEYFVIEFIDNGIGFDEEYSSRIFEAFQRLHGKNEYSGTGIGLFIVKKIVSNHKGVIDVKSKVGIGSTFTIYFPILTSSMLKSSKK
ncbi:MAG: PAS domain-containing protein, partial [Flavobacterium sp.]|nr:PAS domain-containing protein [Flavobacterium sp.]